MRQQSGLVKELLGVCCFVFLGLSWFLGFGFCPCVLVFCVMLVLLLGFVLLVSLLEGLVKLLGICCYSCGSLVFSWGPSGRA